MATLINGQPVISTHLKAVTNSRRYKDYRAWPAYALAASVPVSMAAINIYHKAGEAPSDSNSFRLNFWHRSLQAIEEQPLTGFGAGSWVQQYHHLDSGVDQRMGALLWEARKFPASPARELKSLILILAITSLFNSVLYDGVIGDYFCLMLGLLLGYGKTHPPVDAVIPCGPAWADLQTP